MCPVPQVSRWVFFSQFICVCLWHTYIPGSGHSGASQGQFVLNVHLRTKMISRCDFVSVRHSGSFSLPRDIIMPFQGLDVSVCTETTLHISLSSNQSQGLATLYPEVLGKLLGPKAGQIYRNHFWFHFCFSFLFFLERTMFLFLFYQHSL